MADIPLTAWKAVQLPTLPANVTSALNGITALGNATVSALEVVTEILDALANITVETDPAKAILQAAIKAIEDGLRALLEDAGVYVLFVPVRRKVIVSPLIQDAAALTGLTPGAQDADINLLAMQARLVANNAAVGSFFRAPADGGNAGFFRTVYESILDEGDPNRPLFPPTDYVAGVHVLAGSSDYVNLLSFITALDSLMVAPGQANHTLSTPGLPVPQNLKAQSVRLLDGNLGGRLTWDAQVPVVPIEPLASACLITHLAIVRSTNAQALASVTPESLFGTKQLTKGMKAVGDDETQVIDILDYGVAFPPAAYEDNTAMEEGKTYFYFACFRFKMGNLNELASGASYPDQGFYHFSNVAFATAQLRSVRSGRGTPPDWMRTPSVADLLPLASELLTLLIATLNQFRSGVSGAADALKRYIKFLQAEIDRLKRLIQALTGVVQRLTSLAGQEPHVGMYGRAFFGKGGTDYMLSDLAASLAPTNGDPNRPPFDRGDEFVSGVVVVVGGPSEDAVVAVKLMLETMFGISSAGGPTPLQQAIAAIDVVLTSQEEASFGDDFTVGAASTTTQAVVADVRFSDEDPGSCAGDTTAPPTFGDDFGVT